MHLATDGRIRDVVRAPLSGVLIVAWPGQIVDVEKSGVRRRVDPDDAPVELEDHVNGVKQVPDGFVVRPVGEVL